MLRVLFLLCTPLLAVGLAACATSAPVPPRPGAAKPSVVATPASPGGAVPTAPAARAAATLELRGDGLGGFAFGAPQADVARTLETRLGKAEHISQGVQCELDSGGAWGQVAVWGGFWVQFDAEDRSKTSPRRLAAWGLDVRKLTAPLAVQDDVPLNLSFAQLRATYPKGRSEDLGLGDGSTRFVLPNKLFFVGFEDEPLHVQAGAFGACE